MKPPPIITALRQAPMSAICMSRLAQWSVRWYVRAQGEG